MYFPYYFFVSIVHTDYTVRNEEYTFDRNHLPMPGWELKVTWLQEESLPTKGILSLEVYAGNGMNMDDCSVSRRARNMMMSLVLCRQRDIYEEISADQNKSLAMQRGLMSGISIKENAMEYGPSGRHTNTSHPLSQHTRKQHNGHTHHVLHAHPQHAPHHVGFADHVQHIDAAGVHTTHITDADYNPDEEYILHDTVTQLAYDQLPALERYESRDAYNASPSSKMPRTMPAGSLRSRSDDASAVFANLEQTGSNSKFMKTYRLDDLHANLRARTSITWNYLPPQPGKVGTVRATQKGGT